MQTPYLIKDSSRMCKESSEQQKKGRGREEDGLRESRGVRGGAEQERNLQGARALELDRPAFKSAHAMY